MRMKHLFFILTFICCFAAVSKAEPQPPVTLEAARDGLTVRFPVRSVEPLIRESLLQKKKFPENKILLYIQQDHPRFYRSFITIADLMNRTAGNGAEVRYHGDLVEIYCPWRDLVQWGMPENPAAFYVTVSQEINGRSQPGTTARIKLAPPAEKLSAQIMKDLLYAAWQEYIDLPEEKLLTDLAEEKRLLDARNTEIAAAASAIAAFDSKSFPEQKAIFRKYYPYLTQNREIFRQAREKILFRHLLNDPEEKR